jgi:hypothetical protein
MLKLDMQQALRELSKDFNHFQRQQIPFINALALTRIAQNVEAAQTAALPNVFNNPTPFTRKGVAIIPARKSAPTATVYIRDIQAQYLLPHQQGGRQVLGSKRGILAPRNVGLNAYGNLPRSKLATLKAKPTVFTGRVKTKSGRQMSGVWQRTGKGKREKLRLLIQFTDPASITPSFGYYVRAERVINATYRSAFEAATNQALATAR